MATANYLAMDFGASSGRGFLARFDGETLTMDEVHRFPNHFVDLNGLYYWNAPALYGQILEALEKVRATAGHSLQSVGIDTWGTDYGLLDKNGQLLGGVRCMRGTGDTWVKALGERIPQGELYARTGLQTINGNTLFQLYERLERGDTALANAATLLMTPDLLAYFLTGTKACEYSMASTSMLLNPRSRAWNMDLIGMAGLPGHIFPTIVRAGAKAPVLPSVSEQTGFAGLQYVAVGTHDTASAVAATPLADGELFCSSGTWSLMGMEVDEPILSEEACRLAFSNEGGADGRIRLLKNNMGMWVLQECKREWERGAFAYQWDGIVDAARACAPFARVLNLEDPAFYTTGGMQGKINAWCVQNGQTPPGTVGETARCVYESIALRYRMTAEQLASLTGKPTTAIRIVGGGSQNALLNQMVADATGLPVYAGPVEAACAGNALMQAMAAGEIANLAQLRAVVAHSYPASVYEPHHTPDWDDAYDQYAKIV